MKREYVVQYNNGVHSCGPIALLNALRHQGHRATRRHLPFLARKLKSRGRGVYCTQLERVGRQMGVMRRINRPTTKKLERHLMKGNGVVLRVGMTDDMKDGSRKHYGHYFFIAGIQIQGTKVSYLVCNLGRRCKWREWEEVRQYYFKRYDSHWYTHAWSVPRKRKKGLRLVS